MKVFTDKKAKEVLERAFKEYDIRESAELVFSDIEFHGEMDFMYESMSESPDEHHQMLYEHYGEKLKKLYVARVMTELCEIAAEDGYVWRATPKGRGWEVPKE